MGRKRGSKVNHINHAKQRNSRASLENELGPLPRLGYPDQKTRRFWPESRSKKTPTFLGNWAA